MDPSGRPASPTPRGGRAGERLVRVVRRRPRARGGGARVRAVDRRRPASPVRADRITWALAIRRALSLGATVAVLAAGANAVARAGDSRPTVRVPATDVGADSLGARQAAQERDAGTIGVDHAFRFTDRLPESGITFVHRITDDSGKFYKPNHYDHGTGIVAADVDGDGLPDIYFANQVGGN